LSIHLSKLEHRKEKEEIKRKKRWTAGEGKKENKEIFLEKKLK
jgi:hypothetical protein